MLKKKIKEREEELFGLVLNEGEEEMLKALCWVFDIPITYPSLFGHNQPHHILWSFSKSGIGLTGVSVMRCLTIGGNKIFHGVNEMKEFLLNNYSQWKKGFYRINR